MNSASEIAQKFTAAPLPDLTGVVSGLSHTTRWKMLKELSGGEARSIDELAKVSGCAYGNAARHLIRLRQAGLVVQGRGRLYNIPKQYLPSPGQAVVDYGHCLLRLDAAG
jgi:DNA-binding transcriptional ArsR family regulator